MSKNPKTNKKKNNKNPSCTMSLAMKPSFLKPGFVFTLVVFQVYFFKTQLLELQKTTD